MSHRFIIPLSYNAIETDVLSKLLHQYTNRHHDDLIHDFEKRLREMTGSPYVVALSSGTSAIHLGLQALGVGSGDFVIVSTFTYVATVNPILYLGAIPVFVDSEATTWNMDPGLLEQAIDGCIRQHKKPKAIIVVHTYGMPADMTKILAIAKYFNVPVLEDAAEAIGSTWNNRSVGTVGRVGIFSFNNNKIITTFGGGALLTDVREIYENTLHWATQSRENLPYYEHAELGYNYRIGPINAAVGLTQLDMLKEEISKRRSIFEGYQKLLPELTWQLEPSGGISNHWIIAGILRSDPEKARKKLEENRIETRRLWKPMHLQPFYAHYKSFINGTSERLFEKGLCLPSGGQLSDTQVESISVIINRNPKRFN
jgi:dTDP-4-amino-4,6-dideoxygalactose transaminase